MDFEKLKEEFKELIAAQPDSSSLIIKHLSGGEVDLDWALKVANDTADNQQCAALQPVKVSVKLITP